MRAVVFEDFRTQPVVAQLPDPTCPTAGALIQVRSTGLCRSDWHGWMGHDEGIDLPHVPGHELAGVIAEVGASVKGWQVGDRVTVPFVCACGQCETCLRGDGQVCERQSQPGFTHWGSFAELVAIDRADVNLIRCQTRCRSMSPPAWAVGLLPPTAPSASLAVLNHPNGWRCTAAVASACPP